MARYIDADKFKIHLEKAMEKMHLIHGVKGVDVGAVIKALDMQPTADVAPKSEVERLQAENERLTIKMNAYGLTAKRLEEDVDRLQDINNRQVEDIRLAKAEVAREIFAEIEKWLAHEYVPYIRGYSNSLARNFAELKKKYTEGET